MYIRCAHVGFINGKFDEKLYNIYTYIYMYILEEEFKIQLNLVTQEKDNGLDINFAWGIQMFRTTSDILHLIKRQKDTVCHD